MRLADELRANAEKNDTFDREIALDALRRFFTEHPQSSIELFDHGLKGLEISGGYKDKWHVSKPIFGQVVALVVSEGFVWKRKNDGYGSIELY